MTAITTLDGSSVDKLGVLLAQIADLTKQANAIKDQIKDGGVSVEGALFKAAYVECNRSVVDYKKLIADFDITDAIITQYYTSTTAVFSVKVSSR